MLVAALESPPLRLESKGLFALTWSSRVDFDGLNGLVRDEGYREVGDFLAPVSCDFLRVAVVLDSNDAILGESRLRRHRALEVRYGDVNRRCGGLVFLAIVRVVAVQAFKKRLVKHI